MNKLQRNAREARIRRLQKEQQRLYKRRIDEMEQAIITLKERVEHMLTQLCKVGLFEAADTVDKLGDVGLGCTCGHSMHDHPIAPAPLPSGAPWPCIAADPAGHRCPCPGYRPRLPPVGA